MFHSYQFGLFLKYLARFVLIFEKSHKQDLKGSVLQQIRHFGSFWAVFSHFVPF